MEFDFWDNPALLQGPKALLVDDPREGGYRARCRAAFKRKDRETCLGLALAGALFSVQPYDIALRRPGRGEICATVCRGVELQTHIGWWAVHVASPNAATNRKNIQLSEYRLTFVGTRKEQVRLASGDDERLSFVFSDGICLDYVSPMQKRSFRELWNLHCLLQTDVFVEPWMPVRELWVLVTGFASDEIYIMAPWIAWIPAPHRPDPNFQCRRREYDTRSELLSDIFVQGTY